MTSCSTQKTKSDVDMLRSVPFQKVTLEDNFWHPRLVTQKETLVPFALDKVRPAMDNLRKTGQYLKGDKSELPFPHRFVASDLYKVMEGAAYLLTLEKDPALEHTMDSIIDLIGSAQQKDGYLYESHTTGVSANHEHWGGSGMGDKPYSWVLHSHELYNMGHMYEGAVAYYQATGKDKWLKIAEKNARHVNKVFFEGDANYNGGVQVPESWSMQYIQDGSWHDFPIYVTDEYRSLKDQYNMVHPGNDIHPEALRINITPKDDAAAGIPSIQIEEAK